jgi:hypothetical protein
VSAIFPAIFPDALFHAKQVRIGAVDALAQRYANLWNREMAGATYTEEILANDVALAFLQIGVVLDKAENPAPHEYVRMRVVVCLDLLEAFIQPVNAVSAVYHCGVKRPREPNY